MENSDSNIPMVKKKLQFDNVILIAGIATIVVLGPIGLLLGIITLVLAGTALKKYNHHPDQYLEISIKKVKAGRILAVLGICLLAAIFSTQLLFGA